MELKILHTEDHPVYWNDKPLYQITYQQKLSLVQANGSDITKKSKGVIIPVELYNYITEFLREMEKIQEEEHSTVDRLEEEE